MLRHNHNKIRHYRSYPIIAWFCTMRHNLTTLLSIIGILIGAMAIFMVVVGLTGYGVMHIYFWLGFPYDPDWTADLILLIACFIDLIGLIFIAQRTT